MSGVSHLSAWSYSDNFARLVRLPFAMRKRFQNLLSKSGELREPDRSFEVYEPVSVSFWWSSPFQCSSTPFIRPYKRSPIRHVFVIDAHYLSHVLKIVYVGKLPAACREKPTAIRRTERWCLSGRIDLQAVLSIISLCDFRLFENDLD